MLICPLKGHDLESEKQAKTLCGADVRIEFLFKNSSSARLGNPADADIDFGNLIPGRIIYDSRLRKIKNTLEGTDSLRGARTVDAVGGDTGNSRIILGNAV